MSDLQNDVLLVPGGIRVPMAELQFDFARSSGPGGQNVNKVNTKAQMRWAFDETESLNTGQRQRFEEAFGNRLTKERELLISSQEHRTQIKNRAACLDKLRSMLMQIATPPKRRRPTRRTAGSKRRRLEAKRQNSEKKALRKRPGWDA